MSETPIDHAVLRSESQEELAHFAKHLIFTKMFHPTVVVQQLLLKGCDEITAQTIVDGLIQKDPRMKSREKGARILSVLLWLAIAAGAGLLLLSFSMAILPYIV